MNVTDPARRDRLRELLDAVVDADNAGVGDMARSSFASEFHFTREVRRLTGEPPAALRRRIMLERAAWRLRGGEPVSAVAADEGWSSAEVFSRAFRRTFGVPPSKAADIAFRLPAPNGLHFHPPQSLWLDSAGDSKEPDISQLMVAHDIADTAYLIDEGRRADRKSNGWSDISPGQVVLEWDGAEPSVGAVLGAIVWTKEVWLATIEGRDFPGRESHPTASRPRPCGWPHDHDELGNRWSAMVSDHAARGPTRRHDHRRAVRSAGVVSALRHRRARADLFGAPREHWPARCWRATASTPARATHSTG